MGSETTKWLVSVAALFSAGCAVPAKTVDTCPPVDSVRVIPLKKGTGHDPVYERLVTDDACERVLIRALNDVTKMKDPRQSPHDNRFVVADAAVFIFLIRRQLDVEAILPDDVAALLESQGIYAYFDFVETRQGRQFVEDRVKQLAGKQR